MTCIIDLTREDMSRGSVVYTRTADGATVAYFTSPDLAAIFERGICRAGGRVVRNGDVIVGTAGEMAP